MHSYGASPSGVSAAGLSPGRTIAVTLDAYLAYTDAVVAFAEELPRDLLGREIPQVLLLHANEIRAEVLPAMLDLPAKRGQAFVNLDRAVSNGAYATEDAYVRSGTFLEARGITGEPLRRPAPVV